MKLKDITNVFGSKKGDQLKIRSRKDKNLKRKLNNSMTKKLNRMSGIICDPAQTIGLDTELKLSPAITVHYTSKIVDVAKVMSVKDNTTCVLVIDDRGQLCGILTDKDIVFRVLATGMDPKRTAVHTVMTANPVTATIETAKKVAMEAIYTGAFWHIPIISESDSSSIVKTNIIGMINLNELFGRDIIEKLQQTPSFMEFSSIPSTSENSFAKSVYSDVDMISRYENLRQQKLTVVLDQRDESPPEIDGKMNVSIASNIMKIYKKGAVIVCDTDTRSLLGILTTQDLILRVVAAERYPTSTSAKSVMTPNPPVVNPNKQVSKTLQYMLDNNYKYIVIGADLKITGIVDILEVTRAALQQLQERDEIEEDAKSRKSFSEDGSYYESSRLMHRSSRSSLQSFDDSDKAKNVPYIKIDLNKSDQNLTENILKGISDDNETDESDEPRQTTFLPRDISLMNNIITETIPELDEENSSAIDNENILKDITASPTEETSRGLLYDNNNKSEPMTESEENNTYESNISQYNTSPVISLPIIKVKLDPDNDNDNNNNQNINEENKEIIVEKSYINNNNEIVESMKEDNEYINDIVESNEMENNIIYENIEHNENNSINNDNEIIESNDEKPIENIEQSNHLESNKIEINENENIKKDEIVLNDVKESEPNKVEFIEIKEITNSDEKLIPNETGNIVDVKSRELFDDINNTVTVNSNEIETNVNEFIETKEVINADENIIPNEIEMNNIEDIKPREIILDDVDNILPEDIKPREIILDEVDNILPEDIKINNDEPEKVEINNNNYSDNNEFDDIEINDNKENINELNISEIENPVNNIPIINIIEPEQSINNVDQMNLDYTNTPFHNIPKELEMIEQSVNHFNQENMVQMLSNDHQDSNKEVATINAVLEIEVNDEGIHNMAGNKTIHDIDNFVVSNNNMIEPEDLQNINNYYGDLNIVSNEFNNNELIENENEVSDEAKKYVDNILESNDNINKNPEFNEVITENINDNATEADHYTNICNDINNDQLNSINENEVNNESIIEKLSSLNQSQNEDQDSESNIKENEEKHSLEFCEINVQYVDDNDNSIENTKNNYENNEIYDLSAIMPASPPIPIENFNYQDRIIPPLNLNDSMEKNEVLSIKSHEIKTNSIIDQNQNQSQDSFNIHNDSNNNNNNEVASIQSNDFIYRNVEFSKPTTREYIEEDLSSTLQPISQERENENAKEQDDVDGRSAIMETIALDSESNIVLDQNQNHEDRPIIERGNLIEFDKNDQQNNKTPPKTVLEYIRQIVTPNVISHIFRYSLDKSQLDDALSLDENSTTMLVKRVVGGRDLYDEEDRRYNERDDSSSTVLYPSQYLNTSQKRISLSRLAATQSIIKEEDLLLKCFDQETEQIYRINYNNDTKYEDIVNTIVKKSQIEDKETLLFGYLDEDRDFIRIESEEDFLQGIWLARKLLWGRLFIVIKRKNNSSLMNLLPWANRGVAASNANNEQGSWLNNVMLIGVGIAATLAVKKISS